MLDDYITGYYGDLPEDEPECVICGVAIKRGETYCGDSCMMADEEGLV